MKAGDRIRVQHYYGDWEDYTIEEFRFCLGFFATEEYREAGEFTPLCEMYTDGPDSEQKYISNHGDYRTNQVPAWCDIP
jgi:hypothetical protein